MKKRGIAAAAIVACFAQASAAGAATLTPNTTVDELGGPNGICSLREALDQANGNANGRGCVPDGAYGNDTIILTDPAGYTLTRPQDMVPSPDDNLEGDLDVNPLAAGTSVTIIATVPTAIDGGLIDRAIDVQPSGVLNISGLTIRDGLTTAEGAGGIRVLAGGATLNLSNVTVTGNRTSCCAGGGIASQGATTLTNVTISGNSSAGHGGGLVVDAGTTSLNSVTISGNTNEFGGAGNGGGVNAFGGNVNLRDTVVAGNTDASGPTEAPDCAQGAGGGTITSLGNNLFGRTDACFLVTVAGDIANQPAQLGALASNGGLTQTHSLMEASPAIDTGSAMCPGADQRGVTRPQRARCDIGAFELEPVPAVPAVPALAPAECARLPATVTGTAAAETLTGTRGRDVVAGLGGKDRIRGRGGNDLLCGGPGKDRLLGGPGKDRLIGGPGADALIGAKGRDICKGGAGKDRLLAC